MCPNNRIPDDTKIKIKHKDLINAVYHNFSNCKIIQVTLIKPGVCKVRTKRELFAIINR